MITGLKAFVTAFCRMILSGDRIDSLFDLSFKRWNWAGNDRPFKHTTLNGTHQVCVEITRTNVFLNSGNPVQQNIAVDNEPYTISFEGDGIIELTNAHTATIQGTAGVRTELTFTPAAGTLNVDPTNVEKVQVEKGSFSTTYIETGATAVTRLSPNPFLNDTLPLEGVIAGWMDAMRGSNAELLRTNSSATDRTTQLRIVNANVLRFNVYGFDGGSVFINHNWIWSTHTRKKFGFLFSFIDGELSCYVCETNGNCTKAMGVMNYTNTSLRDIAFTGLSGQADSVRLETALYSKQQSNIVTDQEAKEILSKLSKYKGGANLEPNQIVI